MIPTDQHSLLESCLREMADDIRIKLRHVPLGAALPVWEPDFALHPDGVIADPASEHSGFGNHQASEPALVLREDCLLVVVLDRLMPRSRSTYDIGWTFQELWIRRHISRNTSLICPRT